MSPRDNHVPDSSAEQGPLEELFGTVFELAGEVASGISQDEVEARLRQTLREAFGQAPTGTSAAGSVGPVMKAPEEIDRGGEIKREPSRPAKIRHKPTQPGPVRYPPLVAAVGDNLAMQAVPVASPAESDWDVPPSIFGARAGGPTVQRLVLGNQLRRLRESRGVTAEQAAMAIRGSYSTIHRMEQGKAGFKERDIADLLTLYGITDGEERAALLNLARTACTPGWWHAYSDILPTWLEPYIGLEAGASVIRTCQNQLIPGLLQTEGYARALIQAGSTVTEEETIRRVELRASRQEILYGRDAPQLWTIIDEAALRRRVGTREVMREQLRHLIELSDHPAVTLQVLPFGEGAHLAMAGPFTILRFAEPDLQDIVYIEQLTSALYLDKPVEVSRYIEVMDRLTCHAKLPRDTKKLLGQILADI